METKLYCVVYRTGGTLNFKWNRTCAFGREKTEELLADVQRQGYKAMLADYSQSLAIGLPETYGDA